MHLFLSFLKLETLEIKFLTREIYENLFVVDYEHKMRKKKRCRYWRLKRSVEVVVSFRGKKIHIYVDTGIHTEKNSGRIHKKLLIVVLFLREELPFLLKLSTLN